MPRRLTALSLSVWLVLLRSGAMLTRPCCVIQVSTMVMNRQCRRQPFDPHVIFLQVLRAWILRHDSALEVVMCCAVDCRSGGDALVWTDVLDLAESRSPSAQSPGAATRPSVRTSAAVTPTVTPTAALLSAIVARVQATSSPTSTAAAEAIRYASSTLQIAVSLATGTFACPWVPWPAFVQHCTVQLTSVHGDADADCESDVDPEDRMERIAQLLDDMRLVALCRPSPQAVPTVVIVRPQWVDELVSRLLVQPSQTDDNSTPTTADDRRGDSDSPSPILLAVAPGLEPPRMARSRRDWHELMQMLTVECVLHRELLSELWADQAETQWHYIAPELLDRLQATRVLVSPRTTLQQQQQCFLVLSRIRFQPAFETSHGASGGQWWVAGIGRVRHCFRRRLHLQFITASMFRDIVASCISADSVEYSIGRDTGYVQVRVTKICNSFGLCCCSNLKLSTQHFQNSRPYARSHPIFSPSHVCRSINGVAFMA